MNQKIILADLVGYDSVLEEQRLSWLVDLLLFIGLDVDSLLDLEMNSIRKKLIENNIDIVFYQSMLACKVYYDGDLIGEWLGPSFILKKDQDSYYYEITLEFWSIQEEELQDGKS